MAKPRIYLHHFVKILRRQCLLFSFLRFKSSVFGSQNRLKSKSYPHRTFFVRIACPASLSAVFSLYRLTEAKGRELIGTASFGTEDNWNDAAWQTTHKGNGNAVQNYTQQYTYDEVGNILQLRHVAGIGSYTRDYTIDSASNRMKETEVGINTYVYKYDTRGNMSEMPHLDDMRWNASNELYFIKRGSNLTSYQYSGGQRIRKYTDKGIVKEERIYLGSFEIYRKFEGSSLKVERQTVHVNDDSGRIAMLEKRTFGTDPSPASLVRYIYSNHLQSASLELDENAAIISYEEYHPYGTTSYQAMNASINAVAKRYRYTGKERDEESGLYYHGARYYIPWLCRWTAVDPLESKYAGMSSYNYSFNNPVMWNDLSGADPGWGKRDNTWEYNANVTADNYSELGYSQYMPSGNVYSVTNGVADGEYNYSLNANGTVQDKSGNFIESPFTTPRGTTINLRLSDQTLEQGFGDIHYQTFKIGVEVSKEEFQRFKSAFLANPGDIMSNFYADYTLNDMDKSGGISSNDVIDIDVIAWFTGKVRVVSVSDNGNSFQAMFQPLKGHPEAGYITFSGSFTETQNGKGILEFTTSNVTRQALGFVKFFSGLGSETTGRFAQTEQWEIVLANVADFFGTNASYASSEIAERSWDEQGNQPGNWVRSVSKLLTKNINTILNNRRTKRTEVERFFEQKPWLNEKF